MYHIILDLEWNQGRLRNGKYFNEIIDMGGVKLDENLNKIGLFHSFIKPSHVLKLSPIVAELTGIDKRINKHEPFNKTIRNFKKWINKKYIFYSWGKDDFIVMRNNCLINDISISWLKYYYDIQNEFMKIYNLKLQPNISTALEIINDSFEGVEHKSIVDALNTMKIFKHIYDKIDYNSLICLKCCTKHETFEPHNLNLAFRTYYHLKYNEKPIWEDTIKDCPKEIKEKLITERLKYLEIKRQGSQTI